MCGGSRRPLQDNRMGRPTAGWGPHLMIATYCLQNLSSLVFYSSFLLSCHTPHPPSHTHTRTHKVCLQNATWNLLSFSHLFSSPTQQSVPLKCNLKFRGNLVGKMRVKNKKFSHRAFSFIWNQDSSIFYFFFCFFSLFLLDFLSLSFLFISVHHFHHSLNSIGLLIL